MAQYGEVRVDYLTYTTGVSPSEGNATTTISGLVNSPTFSGDVTVEGSLTVDGDLIASGSSIVISSGVFASGTATNPSITFTGDLNTGIYSPGADQVAIATNSSGRLFVDASGKVGIGTSSPGAQLDVYAGSVGNTAGDSVETAHIRAHNGNAASFRFITDRYENGTTWTSSSATLRYQIDAVPMGYLRFNPPGGNYDISLGSQNVEIMRLQRNGKVGIGTDSPNNILSIASAAPRLEITDTTTSARFLIDADSTTGGVNFRADQDNIVNNTSMTFTLDGSEAMRIDADGDVGIGTSSPDAKLSVTTSSNWNFPQVFLRRDASNIATNIKMIGFGLEADSSSQTTASSASFIGLNTDTAPTTGNTVLSQNAKLNLTSPGGVIMPVGNVGIGTTSPGAKLEVSEAGATDGILLRLDNVLNAAGTEAGLSILQNSTDQLRCNLLTDREGLNAGVDFKIELSDSAGTIQERFRIKENGTVGIGTTSPGALLDVNGNARIGAATGNAFIDVGFGATEDRNAFIDLIGDTTYNGFGLRLIRTDGGANGTSRLTHRGTGDFRIGGTEQGTIILETDGTERLRVTSTGNVGIGTSSPGNALNVVGSSATTNTGATVLVDDSASLAANIGGSIALRGTDGTNTRTFGLIRGGKSDAGTGSFDGYLAFETRLNGQANTTERVRITNTGNVGIGTSSPQGKLHTFTGTSGATPNANADDLILESSGSVGISLLQPNTRNSRIAFGDPENAQAGMIFYDHSADYMNFTTGATERLRIDSSGNVGIGTSSPKTKLHVQYSAVTDAPSRNAALYLEQNSNCELQMIGNSANNIQLRMGTSNNSFKGALDYSLANDSLDVYTNGIKKVTVLSNGNVGIGTSSPATKLHVYGASGDITLTVQSGSTAGRFLTNATGTYVGTTTNNDFTIQTNSQTRVTVKNTGNVGIGTSSPGKKLDVNGEGRVKDIFTVTGGGAKVICGEGGAVGLSCNDGGGNANVTFNHMGNKADQDGNAARISVNTDSSTAANMEFSLYEGVTAGSVGTKTTPLELETNSAKITGSLEVTDTLNVGIGTNSPGAKLEVSGADQTTSALDTSNLTVSVKSSTLVANSGGSLGFGAATKQWAGIKGLVLNGNNNSIGDLSFSTRRVITDSTLTEAMRITYNGNVGIGTSSPQTSLQVTSAAATGIRSHASSAQATDTNKAFKATNGNSTETFNVSYRGAGFFAGNVLFNVDDSSGVDGGTVNAIKVGTDTVVRFSKTGTVSHQFMQFRRNGSSAVIGSIETNGTSTAYNTSSDYRLKENIVPVADGITRLQQLKPSRFNFITDPDATVDGFIAHEVQDVVPEAITGEKDAVDDEGNPEYQGIDQSKLVPLLTAALQEAIGRIETLEAEVAALKAS